MPIDSVTVGSNQRQIFVLGDPSSSSNVQNIQALTDAMSITGLYAAFCGEVPMLINASGLGDRMRSAIGTIGVASINTEGTKTTYSVGITGFTPAATATDFFNIIGSATKTVRVTRIAISGMATSGASIAISLVKRSAANTSGTPTTPTPVPHDANDAAATAVVSSTRPIRPWARP